MENLRYCSKCIMPEVKPDIFLNEEGICNICVNYENVKKIEEHNKPLESDFIKIISKYKGKQKYDCLVLCSGGKDSTSALYYMKKRYDLNPLVLTFDLGYEIEDAMENIHNAVKILDVDFLFFRSTYMNDLFAKILRSGSKAVLCHPCSIWYMELAFDTAAKYNIPIIVAGWTKGQSNNESAMSKCGCDMQTVEFRAMSKATNDFMNNDLKDLPKYKDFPKSMEEVIKRANKKHKTLAISPHWFLPYGPEVYVETIKKELNWKMPKLSYPKGSTNCLLNFVSVYNSMKYFGYTHYHVEASKHIREGLLTREEAMNQLEINFDKELLNEIASNMNYKFQ